MRPTNATTKNILSTLSNPSIYHSQTNRLRVTSLRPASLRPIPGNSHQGRLFASQALLSRTDFETKSAVELREELHKRGILTGSKKKSILIDKILEDERKTMMSISTKKQVSKKVVNNPILSNEIPPSTARNVKSSTKPSGSATSAEQVVSSVAKVATRLMSEPDGEIPKSPKVHIGPESAALASPKINLKSAGHQAQTWPASINLPETPVEEPLGTVIPFIPDNWTSHQQSHAPQLVDIKPSSVGLQVSTASHPSTLPEGGPSMVVSDQFTNSSFNSTITTSISSNQTSDLKIQDFDQILNNYLKSSPLPSLKNLTNRLYQPDSTAREPFKFEDRPLNDRERTGLYQLLVFLGGSWVLASILDH